MAAVLAALRRVRRPAAAAQRRMSGVPDDIAALQRASVAALSATRAGEGSASAPGAAPGGPQEPGAPLMPPQEPGPEDCCNRGCANCVWEVYVADSAAYAAAKAEREGATKAEQPS